MGDTFRHRETLAVRWGDMDAMGHVNNAAFFTYCESARMSYFAAIEIDRWREDGRHGPAVVSASCNFRRQVHYPATLEVGARATEIGRKSFTLEYAIRQAGSDELVADGHSVVVWVDYSAGKAIPLPEALKERIRSFDGL